MAEGFVEVSWEVQTQKSSNCVHSSSLSSAPLCTSTGPLIFLEPRAAEVSDCEESRAHQGAKGSSPSHPPVSHRRIELGSWPEVAEPYKQPIHFLGSYVTSDRSQIIQIIQWYDASPGRSRVRRVSSWVEKEIGQ